MDATSSIATNIPNNKGYRWSGNDEYNNNWEDSTLQSKVLNDIFWRFLGKYQTFIEPAKWYLGASKQSSQPQNTPNDYYKAERSFTTGVSGGDVYMITNVGLMHASDWGYSLGNEYREKIIRDYRNDYVNNSWIYTGFHEWTITLENEAVNPSVFGATSDGNVYFYNVNYLAFLQAVRPVFYLKENILYAGGNGSRENPYKIKEKEERKDLSDFIIAKKEEDNSIIQINHEKTSQTPATTDYRYVGKNPNNYVYFGCNEGCTEENLYRIIGVIPTQSSMDGEYENRVKLIKAKNWENTNAVESSYTESKRGYPWNTAINNRWEGSTLKGVLNGEYWNSLGEYQKLIDLTKWHLGTISYFSYQSYSTTNLYNFERSNTISNYSKGATFFIGNIGLLYPSDYGYSLGGGNDIWNQSIYNNRKEYTKNAWLYDLNEKYYEWTISPEQIDNSGAAMWLIYPEGHLRATSLSSFSYNSPLGVRPVFFLKKGVYYKGGIGTKEIPYKIGI